MPTDTLRRRFPKWMALRDDPASVGGTLLDLLEGQIQAVVDDALQQLVADGIITTAHEEQASWLVEVRFDSALVLSDRPTVQVALRGGADLLPVPAVSYLSELALSQPNQHLAYLDREDHRLILRPPLVGLDGTLFDPATLPDLYTRILLDGYELTGSHIRPFWNTFDEFALKYTAKTRRYLESNRQLFKRAAYSLRYPPDSTAMGLVAAACVEAGLVAEIRWESGAPYCDLAHPSAYPETVYLCPVRDLDGNGPLTEAEWAQAWRLGYPVHPSQLVPSPDIPAVRRIVPAIQLLSRSEDWILQGLRFAQGGLLELEPSATVGTATLRVLQVGNVRQWGPLEAELATDGTFQIEVATASVQGPSTWQPLTLTPTAPPGVVTGTPGFVNDPLAFRITLYRSRAQDPSPALRRLTLSYEPAPCVVTYLHGSSVHPLGDPALKRTFFTPEGHPTPTLRSILDRIANEAPILWGQMRWDEHYWDTVRPGQGLASVPSQWDPSPGILEQDTDVWQAGIGDLEDLAVRILPDSFSPHLQGGYAFPRTVGLPEPRYRFVTPVSHSVNHTAGLGSYLLPSTPTPGTPLVVQRDGIPLRPAAFLDRNGALTLQAEVQAVSDGRFLILPHRQIDPSSVTGLPSPYSVEVASYDGSHRLPVTPAMPAGNVVTLRYYLEGSFLWNGTALSVYASTAGSLGITYETAPLGESAPYPHLSLSPMEQVLPVGFLYHTSQEPAPHRVDVRVYPDELLADGNDWAWVEVRVLDARGNPVRGVTLTASATARDAGNAGVLTFRGRYGERHVYRYTTPQRGAASVPVDVTLSFQVGVVAGQAVVTLR